MTSMTDRDYSLGPFFDGGRITFPVLRQCLAQHPQGVALEFGVRTGNSLRIIAEQMPVVGFDSFRGLPEAWCEFPAGDGDLGGAVPAAVRDLPNATIVVGLFADSLPGFDFAALGPIGLVHFDADLYSSTKTILEHLGPHLLPGTFCVFDEWGHRHHPDCVNHEQRAWKEFVAETGVDWDVIGHDGEAWGIRLKALPSANWSGAEGL